MCPSQIDHRLLDMLTKPHVVVLLQKQKTTGNQGSLILRHTHMGTHDLVLSKQQPTKPYVEVIKQVKLLPIIDDTCLFPLKRH